MSHSRIVRVLTYGLLGASALASFALPGRLTVPMMYATGAPETIRLTGMMRDFPESHPDFNVVPDQGLGHYAGNVATLLASDGRPLQVHGVNDFQISFGSLVPGVPYSAELTVLGAAITSGGDPIPVTLKAETDTETFEPFGAYADPLDGTLNDGDNPREHTFSLTEIYGASTPIAITATSWIEATGMTSFGNTSTAGVQRDDADHVQVASLMTLPVDATIESITAYLETDNDNEAGVVYGIYTDAGGEPGTLIVETAEGTSPDDDTWYTLAVTPTLLPAGDYWLALSMHNDDQNYTYASGSGQTRWQAHDAHNSGFLGSWGTSELAEVGSLAIHASYAATGYVAHQTANSGLDSPYVKVLKNGDPIPVDVPGLNDQSSIVAFVEDFVDIPGGVMTMQDNQAIYLFELGTTNLASPAADFQDLVALVTLATDPVYFMTGNVTSDGSNPIGYKVDTQWTDSSSRPIAPHTFDSSLGDVAGTKGATSSGGVTSPASFFQWYRDALGVNQSVTHDLVLTNDGSGVYEFHSTSFYPIDGRLYGNEGSSHNHSFTYAVNAGFTYDASESQFVELQGGDGVWLYIDGRLAIDLGGVQSGVTQRVNLSRLGLTHGESYEMSLFYANRHPAGSELHLRTNVQLDAGDVVGSVTAPFD